MGKMPLELRVKGRQREPRNDLLEVAVCVADAIADERSHLLSGSSSRVYAVLNRTLQPEECEVGRATGALESFARRLQLFGWSARTEFEETWVCLLNLFLPLMSGLQGEATGGEDADEEDVEERNTRVCLALRTITLLLRLSLTEPSPGLPLSRTNARLPYFGRNYIEEIMRPNWERKPSSDP